MSGLFKAKRTKPAVDIKFNSRTWFSEDEYKIASRIQALRLQMVIHSYLYYRLGTSLISDDEFNVRAHELVKLQTSHKNISDKVKCFKEDFEDWDGSTGMHLPTNNPWVINKGEQLLARWGNIETIRSDQKIQLPTRKNNSKADRGKGSIKQRRGLF